jgi:hypothetical protein
MRKLSIVGLLVLCGCGTEVGRVPLSGAGQAEAKMTLKAGEVSFWTDLDVDYVGELSAAYSVTVTLGAETLHADCNPLDVNVKTNSLVTSFNDKHSKRYRGKMRCNVNVPNAGEAIVNADLAASGSAEFRKADLIVKQ